MALPNRVSAVLAQETLDGTLAAFTTARGNLPFLIEFTKEQRKKLVRIDESTQPWTAKMLEVAVQHSEIVPPKLSVAEMEKDVVLWGQLIKIDQALTSLKQLVDDTISAVAVDAYSAALVLYHLGNESGLAGEGLEELMDELGRRFARKARKSGSSDEGTPK